MSRATAWMTILFFVAWLGGFIAVSTIVGTTGEQPTGTASTAADALLLVTLLGCIGLGYVAIRRHLTGTAAFGGSGLIAITAETSLLLLGIRLPGAVRVLRARR